MRVVDSHCHADSRSMTDFRLLSDLGYKAIVTQAMFPVEPRRAETLLDNFDRMVERYCGRLGESGLFAYAALGIHPRNAHFQEERNYDRLYGVLGGYLQKENVVALGEVGLDAVDDVEKEVLRRQLEVAKKLGKPVVLHTPGKDKARGLEESLKILDGVGYDPRLVVVDHVDETILRRALDYGGMIGLSVKPNKLDSVQVASIVKAHPEAVDRFVLNSDFGYSALKPVDLLLVKSAADFLEERLGFETAANVASDNAVRLFGLKVPLELSEDQSLREQSRARIENSLRGRVAHRGKRKNV